MKLTRLLALAPLMVPLGCAVPHGANGRPVQPVKEGGMLVGGGAIVPFAAVGAAGAGSDSVSFAGITNGFSLIPAASFDFALNTGSLLGAEVSLLKNFGTGNSPLGVFINPRFEFSLGDDDANRSLALTIDGNLAYFSAGDANAFFLSPTFGVRWYLGIGSGGIVLSQAVGTGFVTLTLPGSLAFDIALGPLHIIPEVKWDPTLFFAGDTGGVLIFFSGGASILVEI